MKTIIYAHPWDGSFNHAILTTVTKQFDRANTPYQVIDLYKESFDPVFSPEELRHYATGDTPYKKIAAYQKMISQSSELIFIFPIWWYDLPAILKGFIDKVMLINFAYFENDGQMQGLLTHITTATVITTAVMTKADLSQYGNPIQNVFINGTLNDIGIAKEIVSWHHLGQIKSISDQNRKQFLTKIGNIYAN
ncbi:NAD(P)H-dependent oxidoreductase [uncultured Leuconostoc sp.]|uniref:NAD(P)H-dependent oxidoreductase n=1 Tax=uncultured Leuconostoc sp. TaxID=173262 RepID=UPI0025DA2E12|nr:NAD(P)H-dependent oxidoreductase [uncultured Leuconostoc sp.]